MYNLYLLLSINGFAQNPKKGMNKLDKKDFSEAKSIFDEVLKEEPENILAIYGMSILFSSEGYQDKDFF